MTGDSPCRSSRRDEAEGRSAPRPRRSRSDALSNLRSMKNTPIDARIKADQDRAPAHHIAAPVEEYPPYPSLSRPRRDVVRPRAPRRRSQLAHAARCARQRQDDRPARDLGRLCERARRSDADVRRMARSPPPEPATPSRDGRPATGGETKKQDAITRSPTSSRCAMPIAFPARVPDVRR